MARYVLFREDPNTHREVYLADMNNCIPQLTADPDLAIPFPTARDGYDFGSVHKLDWWKVGQR